MLKRYIHFKKKYPNTILLIGCNDVYLAINEHADILQLSLKLEKKRAKDFSFDYCEVSRFFVKNRLDKLIKAVGKITIIDVLTDQINIFDL